MSYNKFEYIREFLISAVESSTLDEFYLDVNTILKEFKTLVTVANYFINKEIIECYNKNDKLTINEAIEFLKIEENWAEFPNHNEIVLTDKGVRYYNDKIYEKEIDNGEFPYFETM